MQSDSATILAPHRLKIALYQPQIAPNTGNIARLCVASGAELHLIRPLGFVLSDRNLKRSAMDYWSRLKLTVHEDYMAFAQHFAQSPPWLLTSKASRSIWQAHFTPDDLLLFGNEGHGLPNSIVEAYPDRKLRIPQIEGERCLNLSTAVGIALYEALRQIKPH